jgi:hypothetical protein
MVHINIDYGTTGMIFTTTYGTAIWHYTTVMVENTDISTATATVFNQQCLDHHLVHQYNKAIQHLDANVRTLRDKTA